MPGLFATKLEFRLNIKTATGTSMGLSPPMQAGTM